MKYLLLLLFLPLAHCAGHQPTLAEANLKPRKAIVVNGIIQNVQRDWTYEMPCGLLAAIMGKCDDVQAFAGEIVRPDGTSVQVMFFRHEDSAKLHPQNGDSSSWTLHWDAVYRYLTCAQRGAISNACLAEFSWVIERDEDMGGLVK